MMHDSSNGPDWDALARFIAGESTAEETRSVQEWLARDPRRAELMAALERTIGRMAVTPPSDLDVEAALQRTTARRDVLPVREHAWSSWRRIALPAAAAVALLIGGGLLWLNHAPANRLQVYHTPVGRSDTLVLRDGSRVVLGPGSELKLAAGYGEDSRDVELRGDALFEVRHDERRPFQVRAGSATISDVGTTFAVRSDAGTEVRVVVTSGAVLVRGADAPADRGVILKGGDRGALDIDGRTVTERGVASDDDLAWTRGRLIFTDASLAQVRADLRRWYGIELVIADSGLANRHLTASFAGETVPQVLDVIALALGASVERRGGDTVVMHR
jgi:transmembrane sensor